MDFRNFLCFFNNYNEVIKLARLIFCGDKTCVFNNKGKCRNFKIALNEQGVCMGYNPIVMPVVGNTETTNVIPNNNPIGFGK